MQIRCSKKWCKKHEKCSKMEPKWEQKSWKSLSKTRSENRCEKRGECPEGRRCVAATLLRLIISSRFSSRISSRLSAFSRLGTSCHVSRSGLSCLAFIFVTICASSDASWCLVTVLWRLVYHVCLPGQCTSVVRNVMSMDRQRRQKYRCRKFRYRVLNARSLKRPMLHTSSRLVAGCEYKGLRPSRRPPNAKINIFKN